MRRFFPFFLCSLCCLVACNTQRKVQPIVAPTVVLQPDTLAIPAFSGEVLYLFGREYLAIHDSLSPKFNHPQAVHVRETQQTMAEYIENRLREWYPEVAYAGMVNKWQQIALQLAKDNDANLQIYINREFGGMHTSHPISVVTNDAEEADYLQLTTAEKQVFDALNQLANADTFASRAALSSASFSLEKDTTQAFAPALHEAFAKENILASFLTAGGPYAFYRIILSKQRAERQAKAYYGEDTNSGKQGDAYKHILVNVLLRTYTNEHVARFVMNEVWEHWHVNAPCDGYMDLHNNAIGRELRYYELHQNTADWKTWSENVYKFIQDSTQASFKHWDKETQAFKVLYDTRQTKPEQYIYWNKERTE